MKSSLPAQHADLQSARVFYETRGETGPRLVLLHPIGFDHHSWEPALPYFEDGRRVLLLDLPGHGESDRPANADYSLPSLARRVLAVLDEAQWPDAVFVGNSIGAGVALAAALEAPGRVTGLVLIDSVGFRNGLPLFGKLERIPLLSLACSFAPSFAIKVGLAYARSVRSSVSPELCTRCSRYLRASAGRGAFYRTLRQLYGPTLDEMAARYSQIQAPTLIIHGEGDRLISTRHAERLTAAIRGAKLVRLKGCGHFPQEECPETTGNIIRQFVDQNAGAIVSSATAAAPVMGGIP
ncbi:MAG: alpha/beta hydrolase [Chloroflexi bacterium]|nr:alpha/beta hydrolase [Chloroflexota bacterium]